KQFDKSYSMTKSTLRININKRVILLLPDSLNAIINLTIPVLFFRRESAGKMRLRAVAAMHRAPVPSHIAKGAGERGQAGEPSRPGWRRCRAGRLRKRRAPRGGP